MFRSPGQHLIVDNFHLVAFSATCNYKVTKFGGLKETILGGEGLVTKIEGHKNIKNTLIYTQLIDFGDDEYVCKVARTIEEAKQLIETGFEYICDIDGAKLFRKRK
jgi:hypothetical protein